MNPINKREDLAMGSDSKAPVLFKDEYELWVARFRLFIKRKDKGNLILKSIDYGAKPLPMHTVNGMRVVKEVEEMDEAEKTQYLIDLEAQNCLIQAIPNDIYRKLDSYCDIRQFLTFRSRRLQEFGDTLWLVCFEMGFEDLFVEDPSPVVVPSPTVPTSDRRSVFDRLSAPSDSRLKFGPDVKSFAAAVSNASNTLNFFPLEDKAQSSIRLPLELAQVAMKSHQATLFGYFLGPRLHFPLLLVSVFFFGFYKIAWFPLKKKQYVKSVWGKFGFLEAMMNKNGVYFFKFNDTGGCNQVIEGGPLMIRGVPLFVARWDPVKGLTKPEHSVCPLWVKLHNIPLVAFNKEGISRISSALGVPKQMDACTSAMCDKAWGRPSFAKVLVDVWAVGELKRDLKVMIPNLSGGPDVEVIIDVEYEWEPTQCKHCLVFGHKTSACPKGETKTAKTHKAPKLDEDGFQRVEKRQWRKKVVEPAGPSGVTKELSDVSKAKQSIVPEKSNHPVTVSLPLDKQGDQGRPEVVKDVVRDDLSGKEKQLKLKGILKNPHRPLIPDVAKSFNSFQPRRGIVISEPAKENSNRFSSLVDFSENDNSPILEQILPDKEQEVSQVKGSNLLDDASDEVCRSSFGNWSWFSNIGMCNGGTRILCAWDPRVLDIMLIDSHAQYMNCKVFVKGTPLAFFLSLVYGANTCVGRRLLWSGLRKFKVFLGNNPWLALGDFNSMLFPHDGLGGSSKRDRDMEEFSLCLEDVDLFDCRYGGTQYTWMQKPNGFGGIMRKLDRILLNSEFLSTFGDAEAYFHTRGISDHSPGVISFKGGRVPKHGGFKFDNFLTNHPCFIDVVRNAWRQDYEGCFMFRLVKRLQSLKTPFRKLRSDYGDLRKRVDFFRKELELVQQAVDSNPFNTDLRVDLAHFSLAFQQACLDEEEALRQRAKMHWLNEGDGNTKFFHQTVKEKRHFRRCTSIVDANGLFVQDDDVPNAFVDFYKSLMGMEDMGVVPYMEPLYFSRKLTLQESLSMLAPITDDEIKAAMFGIGNEKAPGSDGFSSKFFKAAWREVGSDVQRSVHDFFYRSRMLAQLNHTLICLIPKSPNASRVTDFRPISCCNVLFKCISKIVAERIKGALDGLINRAQSAFIPGRRISDNILLAHELVNGYWDKRVILVSLRKRVRKRVGQHLETCEAGTSEKLLVHRSQLESHLESHESSESIRRVRGSSRECLECLIRRVRIKAFIRSHQGHVTAPSRVTCKKRHTSAVVGLTMDSDITKLQTAAVDAYVNDLLNPNFFESINQRVNRFTDIIWKLKKENISLTDQVVTHEKSTSSQQAELLIKVTNLEDSLSKERSLITSLKKDLQNEHDQMLKHSFGNAQNLKLVTSLRKENDCLKKKVLELDEDKKVFEHKLISSQSRVMELSKQVTYFEQNLIIERSNFEKERKVFEEERNVLANERKSFELKSENFSQKISDLERKIVLDRKEFERRMNVIDSKKKSLKKPSLRVGKYNLHDFEDDIQVVQSERKLDDQKSVELQKRIVDLQNQLSDARGQFKRKEKVLQHEKKVLEQIIAEPKKPTLVEKDFADQKEAFKAEINKLTSKLSGLSTDIMNEQQMRSDQQKKLNDLLEERNKLSSKVKELEEIIFKAHDSSNVDSASRRHINSSGQIRTSNLFYDRRVDYSGNHRFSNSKFVWQVKGSSTKDIEVSMINPEPEDLPKKHIPRLDLVCEGVNEDSPNHHEGEKFNQRLLMLLEEKMKYSRSHEGTDIDVDCEVISDDADKFIDLIHCYCTYSYHRQQGPPRCAFKIDIRKAYDMVNWKFISSMMHGLGFHPAIIRWIMEMISTVSYSVAVNGVSEGFFMAKRGIRQGDPISPYLFTIVMEGFSLILQHCIDEADDFGFHNRCEDLSISHLCFADDLFVFTRGDLRSVEVLKKALAIFRSKSGLEPSLEKSEVFFGNVDGPTKEAILGCLPFSNGVFPIRYLGVPLSPVRLHNADFLGLVQRVRDRIHNWKCKFLSYGGRRQLIASVLQSMQLHWISVFTLPSGIVHSIEALCRNFLWAQGESARGKCRIAWNDICRPVNSGGLGLKRLAIWNKAFLAKHVWEILIKRSSLWIAWINAHCLKDRPIWDVVVRPDWSWTLRNILGTRALIRPFVFSKIGDGLSTNAWLDYWLECGTLQSLFSFRCFSGEGFSRSSTVKDVVDSLGVGWPNAWSLRAPILQNQIVPILSQSPDVFVWKMDHKQDEFSVSNAYYSFLGDIPIVNWSKVVWVKGYIPKHAMCTWMAIWKRLPTQDRLISWKHIPPDSNCLFCNACVETHGNLFFSCSVLADFWHKVCVEVELLNSPMDIFQVHDSLRWTDMQKIAFSAAIYTIWRERNARLFHKGARSLDALLKDVQDVVIARMAWRNRRRIKDHNDK
ncbi:hypothetical protein OSB04_un000215 [Centaurea solstitialis]|uniref:Reverse transcriptase domain-containing protein n=1 Tax=Centaurea solstitialis TaxID=347529 RepID=A0AA38W3W1_9ASTR|nr:hypothetical protein OSB04_un000215 [Centaurea solstitialis]